MMGGGVSGEAHMSSDGRSAAETELNVELGFEMVESDSRPASVRSSAAALESAEEEDEASNYYAPLEGDETTVTAQALANFEAFYALPRGTATEDQVATSSAWIQGWAAADREAELVEPEVDLLQAALKASAAEEAARVAAEEARLAAAKMEHTLHPTHLTPSEQHAIKSLLERLARDSPPDPQNFVCSNIQPPMAPGVAAEKAEEDAKRWTSIARHNALEEACAQRENGKREGNLPTISVTLQSVEIHGADQPMEQIHAGAKILLTESIDDTNFTKLRGYSGHLLEDADHPGNLYIAVGKVKRRTDLRWADLKVG